jgi:hypothetical protein
MPTIQEIRQQFPQYSDLSDEDLAHGLHDKYYSDMPFEDFAGKIGLSAQQPQQPVGHAAGLLSTFENGMTFGFNDEFASGVDAAIAKLGGDDRPVGDIYRQNHQARQGQIDQYAQEHPHLAQAAELAGGALPTAAAIVTANPELAPGASQVAESSQGLVRRLINNIVGGGTAGVVSGYGNADSDNALSSEIKGGALGGALGLGTGAAVEAAAPISSALKGSKKAVSEWVDEVIKGKFAAPKPIVTDDTPTAPSAAGDRILRSLNRDNIDPGMAAQALQAQREMGKPASIADVGGRNTKGLARTAATVPGPGKQFAHEALNARQDVDASKGRILGDLQDTLGVPVHNTDDLIDDIITKRGEAAGPDYRKAYAQGEITHPDLVGMLDENPVFASAHAKASKVLAGAGRKIQPLYNLENSQLIRYPTVEDVDLIKKGVDRRLYNNKRGNNDVDEDALDAYGSALIDGQRTKLLQTMDPLAPDYAVARGKFSGETRMKEAVEAGRNIFNTDPREVTKTLGKLEPAEREMFKMGAADAVRLHMSQAANRENANLAADIFGTSGKGSKAELMKAVFGDNNSFTQFSDRMNAELGLARTHNFVKGGSNTQDKLAEQQDLELPISDAATDLMLGNVKSATGRVLRSVSNNTYGRAVAGGSEQAREELARRLFSGDPSDDAVEFLRSLDRVKRAREESMRVTRGRGLGSSIGAGQQAGDRD